MNSPSDQSRFICPQCNVPGETEANLTTCPTCNRILGMTFDYTTTTVTDDRLRVSLGTLQGQLHKGRLWWFGNVLSDLRFWAWRLIGRRL